MIAQSFQHKKNFIFAVVTVIEKNRFEEMS